MVSKIYISNKKIFVADDFLCYKTLKKYYDQINNNENTDDENTNNENKFCKFKCYRKSVTILLLIGIYLMN